MIIFLSEKTFYQGGFPLLIKGSFFTTLKFPGFLQHLDRALTIFNSLFNIQNEQKMNTFRYILIYITFLKPISIFRSFYVLQASGHRRLNHFGVPLPADGGRGREGRSR